MRMYNANGSELSPLVMDYRLEYFDYNHWVLHDDKDSLISTEHITGSSSSSQVDISTQDIDATSPKGKFELTLSPPGLGNEGAYTITSDVLGSGEPWLRYDWENDGNFDDNPSSTATFGIYKGNSPQIFSRQAFQ
jgi:hypothetical protein